MPAALVPSNPIKKWFAKAWGWRLQRQEQRVARWERERAKGKARIVVRWALIYSLIMTAAEDFFSGLEGGARLSDFLFHAITYSIGGLFVAYISFSFMEKDYKNAHRHIRIEKIAAGAIPPDKQE